MKRNVVMLVAGLWLLNVSPVHAEGPLEIGLELNKAEEAGGKCRLSFVMQERAGAQLQSLKTDLVVFQKDGAIGKRLSAELGPVRARKTSVKIFDIDMPCADMSGLLLNDVTACGPDRTPDACLDGLKPSTRLSITFNK